MNRSSDPSQLVGKDIIAWNHAQKNSKLSFLLPALAASPQRSTMMPSGAHRQNGQGFSWADLGDVHSGINSAQAITHSICSAGRLTLPLHGSSVSECSGWAARRTWGNSHSQFCCCLPWTGICSVALQISIPAAGELPWHSTQPQSSLPPHSHTPVVLKGL